MIEFVVTENLSEQRLDKVLKKLLREAPDSFVYRMLREKNITLNKKRAEGSDRTKEGDVIRFYFSDETYRKMGGPLDTEGIKDTSQKTAVSASRPPKGTALPVVLCEDDDVLLFVKPFGLKSQKSSADDYSANDWVLSHYAKRKSESVDRFRPSIVNRLDRNTGGIMAAGMSARGLRVLSELFRSRALRKYYYTIVSGEAPESMQAFGWIRKASGENLSIVSKDEVPGSQPIETDWVRLIYDPVRDLSLLKVDLVTGKRHQIRAHLSALGYPVLGDPKYGDPVRNHRFGLSYQCLYCFRVEFPECELKGISGKSFSVPAPLEWPLRPEGDES
ncbi:MAG: RluA family pseudouridine synthase [Lachnospiraceae bacterium]|nr:RluA family pseudouridine synthase [Lachnospiraceae bacterium]